MREFLRKYAIYIFPAVFVVVLTPVLIMAIVSFDPGGDCSCETTGPALVPHTHGAALTSTVKGDMQLLMNVTPAAQLYQIVDGKLELCSGDDATGEMKHVTVDVIDARLAVGEWLPVTVDLVIRDAASGAIVVEAAAPATYSPGHGYHFGDNYRLPNDATYDWVATISPVQALRQEGAQNVWLETVEWEGSFTLDAEGNIVDKPAGLQVIGDFAEEGLHVTLSEGEPVALYGVEDSGTVLASEAGPDSRYFAVDVTDHAVNYEEKLPGAVVTLIFERGGESFEVVLDPVISPIYGFHYGANVALGPGEWQITVRVEGMDFLRHAGAAVTLARKAVSGSFAYTVAQS